MTHIRYELILCTTSFNFSSDMEVSVVSTNGFAGYTFPDPTSKLNVTDSIKLPPEIFANSVAGIQFGYNFLLIVIDFML